MEAGIGMLRMVGDYGSMRRALRAARKIWVNTCWGSMRAPKERYLRSTMRPPANRGDCLYEWWQYANGDVWPIAEIHGEARRELLTAVPGDRNYRGGVHPTTREEVPRGE